MLSFSELWEKCESLYKENDTTSQTILDELAMKINLYKMVDSKADILAEEAETAKSRLLGEILLTLTNLSLKENINVFDALATAYKHRTIDVYSEKYK